jgi:competence protein ComEA
VQIRVWLERNLARLLAFGLVILAIGFGARGLAGESSPPAIEFQTGPSLPDGTAIRVQVAGAVVQPGVFELHAGDRVIDALAAAGGPRDEADMESLNLARRVRDQEQIVVPVRASAIQPAEFLAPDAIVDLNTASEALLDQLPGIGEVYSRRIVDSRRVDGPFKSVEELVTRRVIPQATLDTIRDRIRVEP